jgi:hypothetical protein
MKQPHKKFGKIPGPDAWEGYEDDLDVTYAYNLFFGKSVQEVMKYYSADGRCIERADELRFVPRQVFQYYIQAFTEYLCSKRAVGDSDAASPFLNLLLDREERDPGSVMEIYDKLSDTVDFVASHQKYFKAPQNIYGNFQKIGHKIQAAHNRYLKKMRIHEKRDEPGSV